MNHQETGNTVGSARFYIRAFLLCAVATALVACQTLLTPAQGQQTNGPDVLDDSEIIALLDSDAPKDQLLAAAKAGGYVLRRETTLPFLGQQMLTFEMPTGVTGRQAIEYLEAAEPASTVGVNHVYRIQVDARAPDPKTFAQQMLGWPENGCVSRTPIGMIDTGVDPAAARTAGIRLQSEHFGRAAPANTQHGTEVASILADPKRLRGVRLFNASVMDQTSTGDNVAGADALVRALNWLAGNNVRLVNLSVAGPFNKLLSRAVQAASDRGMILVAAVGNAGPSAGPQYPAAFESVIAVTAVDANDQIYRNATRGAFVDIAAPGVDVFARVGSTPKFVTGTSVAAPFVTARIAADRATVATQDVNSVKAALASNAKDLGRPGFDPVFGAGLLNATGICP